MTEINDEFEINWNVMLGAGGYAEVFMGRANQLNKDIAVKNIKKEDVRQWK